MHGPVCCRASASRWCFSSHSRRLLKQRAFSVYLSISAATQLTAGRRAGGGAGRVRYKQPRTDVHVPGERRLVPVYVHGDTGEVEEAQVEDGAASEMIYRFCSRALVTYG